MSYLNILSDTANNVCNDEGKKTITPQHVVKALRVFQFLVNFQELKMDSYLAKILELGIQDEEDVKKLTDK